MPVLTFTLETKAKKNGGDKYKCDTDETFIVYIPQNISRPNGNILQTLTITIQQN